MIGIIDYDVGNIFSLTAALKRLGCNTRLVKEENDGRDCRALILPGVGAFGDAIKHLQNDRLDRLLTGWAGDGKPLLGICLGMQLLFEQSEEYGLHRGLGLLPGEIVKIPSGVKIPHMGWNRIVYDQEHYLFTGLQESYVYFVHSYYAATRDERILASAAYGTKIPAVVGKDNIIGMQFHPEKSGRAGLKLLENWVNHLTNK
ncbi:MAG: imidazole glycerol phosphate synthase subunit HisH [Peptococcaceae bacterium]